MCVRRIAYGILAAATALAFGAAPRPALAADDDGLSGAPTPSRIATETYLSALAATPHNGVEGTLQSLAALPSQAEFAAALDRISPEHYAAQAEAAWRSSQLFVNSLMNCPVTDGVKVFDRDGRCFWAQVKGGTFEWDQTPDAIGGDETVSGAAWGVQGAIDRYWRLGAAFSVENSEIKTDNLATSDGDRVEAGVMIKGSFDQTMLAAALFAGRAWYDVNRLISVNDPAETALGQSAVVFAGGALRMAHTFKLPGWYIKPVIDVNVTYLNYGDLREAGAFPVRLDVDGADKWVFSVTPAIEAGTLVWLDPDTLARPFVRAGAVIANDAGFEITSRFEAAAGLQQQFTVSPKYDDVYGQLSVGVDIFRSDMGVNFSFAYDAQFGDHSVYSVGSAKLRIAF